MAEIDLKERAHRAMIQYGFEPDFPREVCQEAAVARSLPPDASATDLRHLLWSSIDNAESRDLDQVEYAERLSNDAIRLLVGIADVDERVPKNSASDRHAARNTTSVYTGIAVFPMLPETFSTDLTSLNQDADRGAVIIEMVVEKSGDVSSERVFEATVRNRAKLNYEALGCWLDESGCPPPVVEGVSGLPEQLLLQREAAERLRGLRFRQGALTFGSVEPKVVLVDGKPRDLTETPRNMARELIESFMVAANVSMANTLRRLGKPYIRRVVRQPKRWDRIQEIARPFGVQLPDQPDPRPLADFLNQRRAADPVNFPELSLSIVKLLGPGEYIVAEPGQEPPGHFGLAVHDYSHSTAPNRRYADLVTQRLLKAAAIPGFQGPSFEELASIAAHCTEREDAARKVERLMRKVVAAATMSNRLGQLFDGLVTGSTPKGTYVRLLRFPAEGRLVRGERGVDVGDRVRVRLIGVNPEMGFIDFARE
jgi:exoribonuclease-2